MNRQVHPKPDVPSDEEILSYDNVPVSVASRYLGWPEKTVRLALREGRTSFGTAIRDNGITHKISPGGLVRYKREGFPCMDYETIKYMIEDIVRRVVREELSRPYVDR